MSIVEILIEVFGSVALLLWGTQMVTSGVMLGFGSSIRKTIGQALSGRARAFFAGAATTLALQSSTATGLIAASFSANGLLELETGFMLMLGANVGTALVAKILSFPLHPLFPLLILVGVLMNRLARRTRLRSLARGLIGLGLMLLSLRLLVATLSLAPSSPASVQLLALLGQQPVLAIGLGALAAWLCHSSVAVVLLVVSSAATGNLPLAAGLSAILGANLGGALGPVLEAGSNAARRLPLANLVVRACGVTVGVLSLPWLTLWAPVPPQGLPAQLINAHVAFNLLLALAAAPLAKPLCDLLVRLFPDPIVAADPGSPRHLLPPDANVVASVHLAAAERESLRAADLLAEQLVGITPCIVSGDPDAASAIASQGDSVTALGAQIRRAMALSVQHWSETERQRVHEIQVFTVNMEHAADIIAHQIIEPVLRRHREEGAFRHDHATALLRSCQELLSAHELSTAVFLRRDVDAARALVASKISMRAEEREHFQGRTADSATTSLLRPDIDDDLRLLREMRRVMSHLSSIAYELLEQAGQLRARVEARG